MLIEVKEKKPQTLRAGLRTAIKQEGMEDVRLGRGERRRTWCELPDTERASASRWSGSPFS